MMLWRGYHAVNGCFGFMGGGFWMMLILAAIAIAIIVWVVRNNKTTAIKGNDQKADEVLELLKMQYIKGEITEEEYIRRKKVLEL